MIDLISRGMGWVLRQSYNFTRNYGLAIILFTILIKILLIPLNIKQQKSMKATQEIQPLLLKIQEKYKNNPEKQQVELQKLYAEKKINPFGGCLLLIVQFPIIFAMFYAVAKPITYMFPEELQNESVVAALENYDAEKDLYKEVYYIEEERPELMNTQFLGLNLAQVPNTNLSDVTMWIIPVLSALATYFSSKITTKQSANNSGDNEAAEQAVAMQKNMLLFMPLMTGFIALAVPLGMGLYWLTNNLVSMVVQLWVNRVVNGKSVKDNDVKLLKG